MKFHYIFFIIPLTTTVSAQFGPQQVISDEDNTPTIVLTAEIDGDSFVDVIYGANSGNVVGWFKNIEGSENFEEVNVIDGDFSDIRGVIAADLDGDNDIDILATSVSQDRAFWYENLDGAGTFGTRQNFSVTLDGAYGIIAADLDEDGDQDVVVSVDNEDKIVWFENTDGQGNFGPEHVITSAGTIGRDIAAADIDGDGDQDVLSTWGGTAKVTWFENLDGLGSFGVQQEIVSPGQAANSVFTIDMDGDLDVDVLTSSPIDNSISWFENLDGNGNFGSEQIVSNQVELAWEATGADLDDDGDMDVISVSAAQNEVSWFENLDGNGNFGVKQIITTDALAVLSAATGDLDSDGDMDVLSASQVDDKIAWYENLTILNVETESLPVFTIHPNPVNDALFISSNQDQAVNEIVIFTLEGKKVSSHSMGATREAVNVSHLAAGLYFVQTSNESGASQVLKLVKE